MPAPIQILKILVQIQDKQNRKFLLLGIAAVVALLLDIFLLFLPLVKRSFYLKSQIVSVKRNISNLNQQVSLLDAAKKKLEALKAEREIYEKKFPKEEGVPVLLGEVSTIAGKLGVDIIAVRPVKVEPGQMQGQAALFHEVPIEIVGKGGFHQLGLFINRLETFDRFIEVKDVEIVADKATPRRHSFRLLVATYILKG